MKKLGMLTVFLISPLFLSACWDSYELEERANILGLAVDLGNMNEIDEIPKVTHIEGETPASVEDTIYKVTAQIAVPGKIKLGPEGGTGEGSEKTAWVLETYGHTMKDALANMQQQLAEKLYLGHLQIIVVSEDIAKQGIIDISDYLRRDIEVRRTAWMIISEGDAHSILKVAPPIETVPALYLAETLNNAVRFGKLPEEYLGKFWINLSDIGVDAILPIVKPINNDRIFVSGLSYFKEEKMAGTMLPLEIGAYLAMIGEAKGGYSFMVSLDDAVYILNSQKRSSVIQVDLQNGTPTAAIDIHIDSELDEEINDGRLDEKKIKEIEKEANAFLEKDVLLNLIKRLQDDQSDILGIGARIRAEYSDYWKREVKTTEQWKKIYKEMNIKVKIHTQIRRTGMEWD